MKKFISLFLVSLLFISCSSDNGDDDGNDENYVVVSAQFNLTYDDLKEGSDGYMYYESTGSFPYAYNDVISYEIDDIVGDYKILDSRKVSFYAAYFKVNLTKMRFIFDIQVDEYKALESTVDFAETFITFTVHLKLKEDYQEYK